MLLSFQFLPKALICVIILHVFELSFVHVFSLPTKMIILVPHEHDQVRKIEGDAGYIIK